ncbi:MAG: hypothetical protein KDK08_27990 [Rhizobiaceae bacterium]|nr:hypothetical protein [Rhizobiaceae bacterium]
MTLDNLQKSEVVISKILQDLVETGLQYGTALEFKELGLNEEFEPFFIGCCLWLLDEGIVRCTNEHQVLKGVPMVNPVITAKGFALLGQPFAQGGEEGGRVGEAVKEVATGRRNYAAVGDLVGGVLGGLIKSMGS